MKLGPFTIEHPFILAPMAGITTSPFRRLMRRLGSSLVMSELVSANGLIHASRRTQEFLQFNEEERPIGIQLFGENVDALVKAAEQVQYVGADFLDLNLGCPVPKVIKKGAGSAMCRNIPKLGLVLAELVKSVHLPVTIKIRTGWDADSKNLFEVIKVAEDTGIKWVAIHGRTRAQGYSGEADWDLIGEAKVRSSIPIIGNGDIVTAEGAVKKMKTYGVDAVMIGRGALRNPFIFSQARSLWNGETPAPPTEQDYFSILNQMKALFEEHYPEPLSVMIHARKFLAWFSSGFQGCHEFRRKVFTITESNELWGEAHEFFQKNIKSRDLKFLEQPFLMGGHG